MSEPEPSPAVPLKHRKFRLRGREVVRIEAFSDAVFAFAATLLVVSLEVPKTFAELEASLHGFLAFGLSFTALLAIWAVHNSFFRRFGLQDRMTVILNSALLFVVLFYVYPLKFVAVSISDRLLGESRMPGGEARIASFHDLGTLFVIYGLGFVAVFFCIALLYWHAARQKETLGLDDLERYDALTTCHHYLLFAAVGLLSMAMAWAGVGLKVGAPGWIYALLGPLCTWHGSWRAGRRGRLVR
jgi:low temperature requirement protein LtrA